MWHIQDQWTVWHNEYRVCGGMGQGGMVRDGDGKLGWDHVQEGARGPAKLCPSSTC